MQQWEYHVVSFERFLKRNYSEAEFVAEMNRLGAQGWELAGSTIPTNSFALVAIFKRPTIASLPGGPSRG